MTVEPEPQPHRTLTRRQLLWLAGAGTAGAVAGGVAWRLAEEGPEAPAAPPVRRLGHPFWREPLPVTTPVAPTSADYVSRLTYQATMGTTSAPVATAYDFPYNTAVATTEYSICVYSMPDDWPRTPVWSVREKEGLQEVLDAGVPVPDPADLPDGDIAPQGTDGAVVILQGQELWELWQVRPGGPDGYEWSCEQGGHMADRRSHPGWWAGSPPFGGGEGARVVGYDWGVSASGLSYLGGILTAEDYHGEAISHPLPVAVPITGAGSSTPSHVLPATRYDQLNFTFAPDEVADAYRLPEGTRFRLPHTFDVEGWVAANAQPEPSETGSTAAVLRKVLVCLRDHGLVVAESAGIVGFSAEHEKVFGTRYHPFSAAERPQWGNFGHQVPWSALEQVAVPDRDISVPGSGGR